MKEYDLLIKEYDERVLRGKGKSFEDASLEIEDKINSGDIYLDPVNYSREIVNYNSKKITKKIRIVIEYDPITKKNSIECGDIKFEYSSGKTVRDLETDFINFCEVHMEDREIEADKDLENELNEEMEMI
mgnify:FL=1